MIRKGSKVLLVILNTAETRRTQPPPRFATAFVLSVTPMPRHWTNILHSQSTVPLPAICVGGCSSPNAADHRKK